MVNYMKIGLFTHVYPPMINGVAVSTKTLEEELIKQGHDVFIITNNYDYLGNDFSNDHFLKSISIPNLLSKFENSNFI